MAVSVPTTTWDPLGPQTEPMMKAHDVICVHTMVGTLAGTRAYFKNSGYSGTESHFGVGATGFTYQWQDLLREADANYHSNYRVISIENADKGHEFVAWTGSDVPAFTGQQVARLISLIDILCSKETHKNCPSSWECHKSGIPRELVPDSKPGRRGIGFHRQGVDPYRVPGGERWSGAYAKQCPGDRRIDQLTKIIIPAVQVLGQPVPIPTPIVETEEEMPFFAKKSNNASVFLFESGRMTHIGNRDDMLSLAKSLGMPEVYEELVGSGLSEETWNKLIKDRKQY